MWSFPPYPNLNVYFYLRKKPVPSNHKSSLYTYISYNTFNLLSYYNFNWSYEVTCPWKLLLASKLFQICLSSCYKKKIKFIYQKDYTNSIMISLHIQIKMVIVFQKNGLTSGFSRLLRYKPNDFSKQFWW